jgi:hypothetical protein
VNRGGTIYPFSTASTSYIDTTTTTTTTNDTNIAIIILVIIVIIAITAEIYVHRNCFQCLLICCTDERRVPSMPTAAVRSPDKCD